MSNEETVFAKGMFVTRREEAPDFVVCSVSFSVSDFIEFMNVHVNNNGYVNVDVLMKKDKTGMYPKLNNFKPQKTEESKKEIDVFDELAASAEEDSSAPPF